MSDHSSCEAIHGRESLFGTTKAMSNQTDSHIIDGFCRDLLAQHSDLDGGMP